MKSIILNIGGQDRVFYFGLGFLGNLLEKEGLSIQELGAKTSQNPYKWTPLLMFHSLAYGYERVGESFPVSLNEVVDWVDEIGLDSDVVNSFSEGLVKSLQKDVPEQPEVKKKVMKK